ncbi:hypothetical protein MBLNU459_g1232t1 [Dothideomycetes sp. NU459]
MPAPTSADTIRILVSTDNHVGYNERDPIRGNDSWEAFHEIMEMAKTRDVDMVLLAGDLFHENNPSRKSMYHVMRTLRMNCYGEKPCELEMLSDASENFGGLFNHVNYEDPDINVAIPVFSIHGNHDDPSGEGHLAALDLLQTAGLVNYYGRTPESDNILIKPVLLQKGLTKLALYGMSNVRDERLFRTFRDGRVKFFQPSTQKSDWFNLMSVHQNHHAYTETGYLPENFLPEFLDLVIWGHEHECLIEPRYNPEMSFHVMQPGSSVATSLMPGEAVPKHVSILSITGKEFKSESIRLKSVRPFVMKEIVLQDDRRMRAIAKKDDNRPEITRYLIAIVESMIEEAKQGWRDQHEGEENEDGEAEQCPAPLIRLRVEYTAPEGGRFDCENPQRFSNRFVSKVANVNDVVQFHRKKVTAARKTKEQPEMPEESVMAQLSIDSVKVEKLVREFLTAQSLTILPQNSFGDAVSQFVDKDDKHAMEMFVNDSLVGQVKHLLNINGDGDHDEDEITEAMEEYKTKLEDLFAKGHLKRSRKAKKNPKPDNWDSDLNGAWSDDAAAIMRTSDGDVVDDEGEEEDTGSLAPKATSSRGRGKSATTSSRKMNTALKKAAPAKKPAARNKRKEPSEDEDEMDDDVVIMIDDEDEDEDDGLFVKQGNKKAPTKTVAKRAASPPKRTAQARSAAPKSTAGKQSTLNFSQPPAVSQPRQAAAAGIRNRRIQEPSEDEISDDDDAFEPAPSTARTLRARSLLASSLSHTFTAIVPPVTSSFLDPLLRRIMTQNIARRAYSAEQLLALRNSASDESTLAIETNAEERAIKVLGEIDPNNQNLRPGPTRRRPSPTPSLKKKKAEHILNLHGSPPGLRVTAGGRIVPSDQSPLCSPRYGYSAIQKNGGLIRFAPNYPPPPSALQLQNMSRPLPNGFIAQEPTGRLLQMVDGQFLPVNEVNGLPQLYIAAPNLAPTPAGNHFSKLDNSSSSRVFDGGSREQASETSVNSTVMRQPAVSVVMQIQALEKQYTKLEQEARDLDKVEVLQKSSMSTKSYNQLVQKRRELVSRMNDIRVSLKALRESKSREDHSPPHARDRMLLSQPQFPPFAGPMGIPQGPFPGWSFNGLTPDPRGMMQFPGPPIAPEFGFFPQLPGAFPAQMPPYHPMGAHSPMLSMMEAPSAEAFHNFSNAPSAAPLMFPNGSSCLPMSDEPSGVVNTCIPAQETITIEKESPRRSHALEIKNPENKSESGPGNKSALNPMSPSYQPNPNTASTITPASKQSGYFAGSPSTALVEAVRAHNAWVGESSHAPSSGNSQRAFRYDSSASSYATADFFPTNPRDHSMNKQGYPATGNRSTDRVKECRSSTPDDASASPEKECHNPNWNPTIPDTAFESVVTPPIEQDIVVAPPGTPPNGELKHQGDPVGNRSKMNVSPKSKRPDLLVPYTSGSEILRPSSDTLAYEEGFKAGTDRLPVGHDKSGYWLDGFCAALLGERKRTAATATEPSPSQPMVKLPGTAAESVSRDRHSQALSRPALELNTTSFDTLKEAVFSKQNENAVLSPDPNGPTASEMASSNMNQLPTHQKSPVAVDATLSQLCNGEVSFPERTSSMVQRQLTGPGVDAKAFKDSAIALDDADQDPPAMSQTRRAASYQTQPSAQVLNLQRAYPGQRVLSSQLEWRSGSSIAQVAGLATGYFAQFDGTLQDLATIDGMAPLTRMPGNVGTTIHDPSSKTTPKHATSSPPQQTRFKEASMPADDHAGVSPNPSPTKKSPAKAKFAHIAGKAGIRVRAETKESQHTQHSDVEPMSPQERRRWRDVWRKRFTEEQQQHGRQH